MKPRHNLESILFTLLLFLVKLIPFSLLSGVLRGVARICYRFGLRRRIVLTNLRAALGRDLSEDEITRIALNCYLDFARNIAEVAKPEHIIRNLEGTFHIEGIEILDRALESGKGVICLTGHLGNFPATGYYFRKHGYELIVVMKGFKNESAYREFVHFFERYGASLITVTGYRDDPGGGLKIYRTLKKGKMVVIVNDQDAGPEGYKSTFFGLPTSIPAGPAQFGFRTRACIITGFMTRKHGKIVVQIQEPIDYSGTESEDAAARIILDEYTRRLEEKVRESPEQYFWLHKKWKSVPEIRSRYGE